MEFVEQNKSPEDSQQAICIPQRKRDAQANVADGIDGHGVGYRPHASREHGPNNQMRRLTHVLANIGRTADNCRDAPASQENSDDHDERNRDWRDIGVDYLDRRFGSAKPRTGREPAEHPQGLQSSQTARLHRSLNGNGSNRVQASSFLP